METNFNVKRILLLDTPCKPEMLENDQAVVGTINGEYIFMKKISEEKVNHLIEVAKAEEGLESYELIKKQYADFQEQMEYMYKLKRKILDNLQNHCPHINTYKTDDYFINLNDKPYDKCKDCGKIFR